MLAACLLLLHVLLPALHGWQHAVEAAALRAPCAECGHIAGHVARAAGDDARRGMPALGHQHEQADECALCVAIQLGRSVLLPAADAAVQALSPPVRQALPTAGAGFDLARSWRPPARAPPRLLG